MPRFLDALMSPGAAGCLSGRGTANQTIEAENTINPKRRIPLIQLSDSSNYGISFRCVADNEPGLDVYCDFQIIARRRGTAKAQTCGYNSGRAKRRMMEGRMMIEELAEREGEGGR